MLYGRPTGYTWNPRDPASLMFSYPVGPNKNNLFMDREEAEMVDPREDRGSMVRVKFKDILVRRMYGQNGAPATISPMSSPAVNGMFNTGDAPPSLPPIASISGQPAQPQQQQTSSIFGGGGAFGNNQPKPAFGTSCAAQ